MADQPKTEKWKRARTKDLSASQMKRAQRVVGGGRMEKVTAKERKAAKDFVNIGTTKWMTSAERGGKGRGGLLVDASGKAVTGTVKLPSGQSATYVRGKRIGVPRAGSAGTRAKTDTGRTTGKTTTPPPKTGRRYEERKAAVGAGTVRRTGAGSVGARQGKFGSMTLPGGAAGRIPRTRGQISSDSEMRAAMAAPQPRREGGKSKKPIMYANGTASVYDPKLGRRVTVGRSDPRHPKYGGK